MEQLIIKNIKELSHTRTIHGTIAKYILDHSCEDDIKIRSICEQCFVSPPTVVRFSKKLGYSSFSEFKYNYINALKSEQSGPQNANEMFSDLVIDEFYRDNDEIEKYQDLDFSDVSAVLICCNHDLEGCAVKLKTLLQDLNYYVNCTSDLYYMSRLVNSSDKKAVCIYLTLQKENSISHYIKQSVKNSKYTIVLGADYEVEGTKQIIFPDNLEFDSREIMLYTTIVKIKNIFKLVK